MEGPLEVSEDDSDFVDSENDLEDEDDTLYDRNVTDGIEMGLDGHDQVQDERDEGNDTEVDDLEYPSEELLSQCSSDDEGGFRFPQFSAETNMNNPQFQVGQIFSSAVEFKEAVRTYGALNGYNLKFPTNEERRVLGICKLGCKWRIWASSVDDTNTLLVKSYISDHTCSRDQYNRHCNYKFLTHRYLEQFKTDPDWKTELILATVKKDLRTDISRNVAWKMKRYAKEVLVGTMQDQFERLRSYAAEVLRTNVGSTVIIALQQQVFQGMYICFNGCKMGFRNGCRRVVGVDGCHLRGYFGGILLTAVGLDGNDCIYPVAYAVAQKENTPTWRWFLNYLAEDIEIGNGRGWTLMTDRQKGLQNVTNELFPEAEHRFCVRHMHTNFCNAGFKGKTLKNYLWRAAKSTTIPDYKHWMQQIRNINEDAYKWLTERPPQEWSRSHFSIHTKSDILLNNICEVFNKTLRSDREKMILTMLTSIQLSFMIRIRKRRDTMMRYNGRLCPKIRKKLHKNAERSRECTLYFSGGPKWQVECSSGTYVVDLLERSCACREWELTGIPCMHAVSVIRECRNDPEEYVDNCYSVETYLRCYNYILNPINGMRLWPELDMAAIIPPAWVVPQKGKRQKNRRKGADEDVIMHSQDKTYLRKKGLLKMTCTDCGLRGHNKRYHSRKDAPSDDWFEGGLEPVETQCNTHVTERGKLVGIGGKGASSANNITQQSSFRFMPTPMVAHEAERDHIAPGPAVMMPIRDQHEAGHSVEENVPTVEVNFQEMDVADCSNPKGARARKRGAAKMTRTTSV